MKYIKEKMSSNNVKERIIYTLLVFMVLFAGITVLSYYVLPEGILKGKTPSSNIEISSNIWISILQIFFFNLISVVIIFIGSLFSKKKEKEKNYYSVGYTVFFVLIIINAIILGTWSFGVESDAPTLINRLSGIFNVVERAALWEMIGQMFITCSIAHISVVLTNGKTTTTRSIKTVKLLKSEIICLILGLLFMLLGAVIESISIINVI